MGIVQQSAEPWKFERKMGKEIRIIKKDETKIADGSTFIDDGLVEI